MAGIWWESLSLVAVDYSITSEEGVGRPFTAPGALHWIDTIPFYDVLVLQDDNTPICSWKQIESLSAQRRGQTGLLMACPVTIFNHYWSFMGNIFTTSVLLETFSFRTCENSVPKRTETREGKVWPCWIFVYCYCILITVSMSSGSW